MNGYQLRAMDFEILVAEGAEFYPITARAMQLLLEHEMIPEGIPVELVGGHL